MDNFQPYLQANPGDLLTAEIWNRVQIEIRKVILGLEGSEKKDVADLSDRIKNVDAPKFGGKSPDDWTNHFDDRYIRKDSAQFAGEYRRYFKQVDEQIIQGGKTEYEPVVIEHKLCRYPLVEVYELEPLFDDAALSKVKGYDATNRPFDVNKLKFLLFYASNRDPLAELLSTEAGERIYWGDPLSVILDQLHVQPALTQKLDDLVNDLWGKIFNPKEEDDDFTGDSYGASIYVQKWMDGDKSVDDMVKGGQWDDIKLALRPMLIPSVLLGNDQGGGADVVQVYHLSLNAVEIRVNKPLDMMVLLRT